jgi:hypothetical protein
MGYPTINKDIVLGEIPDVSGSSQADKSETQTNLARSGLGLGALDDRVVRWQPPGLPLAKTPSLRAERSTAADPARFELSRATSRSHCDVPPPVAGSCRVVTRPALSRDWVVEAEHPS